MQRNTEIKIKAARYNVLLLEDDRVSSCDEQSIKFLVFSFSAQFFCFVLKFYFIIAT